MHDAERVAGVEHGVEQVVALHAGQAIDVEMPWASREWTTASPPLISGIWVSPGISGCL